MDGGGLFFQKPRGQFKTPVCDLEPINNVCKAVTQKTKLRMELIQYFREEGVSTTPAYETIKPGVLKSTLTPQQVETVILQESAVFHVQISGLLGTSYYLQVDRLIPSINPRGQTKYHRYIYVDKNALDATKTLISDEKKKKVYSDSEYKTPTEETDMFVRTTVDNLLEKAKVGIPRSTTTEQKQGLLFQRNIKKTTDGTLYTITEETDKEGWKSWKIQPQPAATVAARGGGRPTRHLSKTSERVYIHGVTRVVHVSKRGVKYVKWQGTWVKV